MIRIISFLQFPQYIHYGAQIVRCASIFFSILKCVYWPISEHYICDYSSSRQAQATSGMYIACETSMLPMQLRMIRIFHYSCAFQIAVGHIVWVAGGWWNYINVECSTECVGRRRTWFAVDTVSKCAANVLNIQKCEITNCWKINSGLLAVELYEPETMQWCNTLCTGTHNLSIAATAAFNIDSYSFQYCHSPYMKINEPVLAAASYQNFGVQLQNAHGHGHLAK